MAIPPELRFPRTWANTQSGPLRPGAVRVEYAPERLDAQLGSEDRNRTISAFLDLGEQGGQRHDWELAAGDTSKLTHEFHVPEGTSHAQLWFTAEDDRRATGVDSAFGDNYQFRVAPSHPNPMDYEQLEYVRRPGGAQDEEKLAKLIDGAKSAVVENYEDWVHRTPPESFDAEAFTALLQSMHRTMMGGGYDGHLEYAAGDWRRTEPGKLFLSGSARDPLGFNIRLSDIPDPRRFSFYPGSGYERLHPIEGVQERVPPRNRVARKSGYVLHQYREGYAVKRYLARTAEIDHALRAALWEDRPAEALMLLSQYFHTAINGHFFKSVNNSLLMAQVNHNLHELGLLGIPAESLDYIALTNGEAESPGSTRFRDIFLDAVLARNPDAAAWISQARTLPSPV